MVGGGCDKLVVVVAVAAVILCFDCCVGDSDFGDDDCLSLMYDNKNFSIAVFSIQTYSGSSSIGQKENDCLTNRIRISWSCFD